MEKNNLVIFSSLNVNILALKRIFELKKKMFSLAFYPFNQVKLDIFNRWYFDSKNACVIIFK